MTNGSLIVREIKPIVVVQFKEGLASDAGALGEAQDFSGRESVDGLTAPPSAQKTGTGTRKLSQPEQTRSLEPLASTDESTSQVHKLTETSSQDKQAGPLAVGELDAVEDSLGFVSNDSEAATSIVPPEHASGRMEAYANSGHDSLSIITADNKGQVQGETYPVTSSASGHSILLGEAMETRTSPPLLDSGPVTLTKIQVKVKVKVKVIRRPLVKTTVVPPIVGRFHATSGGCCWDQQSVWKT